MRNRVLKISSSIGLTTRGDGLVNETVIGRKHDKDDRLV